MGKYVTKQELTKVIESTNKALLIMDVMLEVLAKSICKVDENEFGRLVDEAIKRRANVENQVNDLENKKE